MFSDRFCQLNDAVSSCIYSTQQELIGEEKALFYVFDLLSNLQKGNGIVYVIGNGGSAGIASHFSTDLIKTLKIPSQTLYDSNHLFI
jgi:phosphoheptose isomerase